MSTAEAAVEGAVEGAVDQSRSYGAALHTVYDHLFPPGPAADALAEDLLALTGAPHPVVVELGVGTGRVALPLARRGARVTGVDSSPELLAVARAAADREGTALRLVRADLRSWVPDVRADLVVCVCATLSMLLTAAEQRRALAVAAAALAPGGRVVVETHRPDPVRRLHAGRAVVELDLPSHGLPGGVRTTSRLPHPDATWTVEHRWHEDGRAQHAVEHARLLDRAELLALAAEAGLAPVPTPGRLADPGSPTYTVVLAAADPRPTTAGPSTPEEA